MAKFIKDIHDLVNFLAGKNIATQQPPERIDLVVYEVVNSLFNGYYDHYVKTQKISDYLLPFKRTKTLTVTDGVVELPADYQHARALQNSQGKKIDLVEDKFWDGRKNSRVAPPTEAAGIARIEIQETDGKKVLLVFPSQTPVVLEYFKAPTRPLYKYLLQGTKYVYDDANSVDIEFSQLLFDDIKKRVCSSLGINLRDQQLTIYSEQQKNSDQLK